MGYGMNYEYLIRKAYGCGRFGVAGANADIYRTYERVRDSYRDDLSAIKKGQQRSSRQGIEDMAYEAALEIDKVVAFIESALSHVKQTQKENLTNEQNMILGSCELLLGSPTQEKIEKVIDKVHKVLSGLGLQMR